MRAITSVSRCRQAPHSSRVQPPSSRIAPSVHSIWSSIQLWRPLASKLVSIIGEGGFNSLYARSLYLTHAPFPWLAPGDTSRFADFRLPDLKISLDGQSATEANKASHMLLLTFTNILASLIGEPLMTNILSSAWGDDAADMAVAVKEIPNA